MGIGLPYTPEYVVIDNDEKTDEAIAELSKHPILSIDTETTGLDPYTSNVLLIQIAIPDFCYIFDCSKTKPKKLKQLLENPAVLKLLQNAKFDYKMMKVSYGIEIKNIFCTMTAERVMITGLYAKSMTKASLKVLTEKYLGFTLDKEIRKAFVDKAGYQRSGFSKDELDYAANDAIILYPIYEQQAAELEDRGLIETAILEFRVLPVVADMELNGSLFDKKRWSGVLEKVRARREVKATKMLKLLAPVVPQSNLFGMPVINIGSHAQILAALRKLGVRKKDGSLIDSTGDPVLSEINKKKYPIVAAITDYRGDETILSRYGLKFIAGIHKITKRVHTIFDQLGTGTGRFSSYKPNLQNIPGYDEDDPMVDMRGCFVPPKGYKLVCADYSQQELRILAEMSGDPVFEKAFLDGEDRHAQTAADIFHIPLADVTKEQRKTAKTVNFAIVYGSGPGRLAAMLDIKMDEAIDILNKYFKVYPKIKSFLNSVGSQALRDRYASTAIGRKRYFWLPKASDADYKQRIARIKRQAQNMVVQGGGADVTKLALVYVDEEIRRSGMDAKIVLTVHDEIVLEVKEEEAEAAAKMLEERMLAAFTAYFKRIPMVVDAVIADYWIKA